MSLYAPQKWIIFQNNISKNQLKKCQVYLRYAQRKSETSQKEVTGKSDSKNRHQKQQPLGEMICKVTRETGWNDSANWRINQVSAPRLDDQQLEKTNGDSWRIICRTPRNFSSKGLYQSRFGRSDIRWTVNHAVRLVTKWSTARDETIGDLVKKKDYLRMHFLSRDADFAEGRRMQIHDKEFDACSEVKRLFQFHGYAISKQQYHTAAHRLN